MPNWIRASCMINCCIILQVTFGRGCISFKEYVPSPLPPFTLFHRAEYSSTQFPPYCFYISSPVISVKRSEQGQRKGIKGTSFLNEMQPWSLSWGSSGSSPYNCDSSQRNLYAMATKKIHYTLAIT